jgi:hypothetical protein
MPGLAYHSKQELIDLLKAIDDSGKNYIVICGIHYGRGDVVRALIRTSFVQEIQNDHTASNQMA